jgi:hypothetical protein
MKLYNEEVQEEESWRELDENNEESQDKGKLMVGYMIDALCQKAVILVLWCFVQ